MKKIAIVYTVVASILCGFAIATIVHKPKAPAVLAPVASERALGAAMPFSYNSATQATSTVGIYAWSTILSADSGRGYVSFCNDSRVANSAIYLAMGATSTVSGLGMFGRAIPANTCYEMTLDNMFYGNIYGIATSATSTLLTVKAGF